MSLAQHLADGDEVLERLGHLAPLDLRVEIDGRGMSTYREGRKHREGGRGGGTHLQVARVEKVVDPAAAVVVRLRLRGGGEREVRERR